MEKDYESFKKIEPSIDEYEKRSQQILDMADEDLKIIKPSLKDLVFRIENEKPDAVVFLDRSARILATPIRDYLKEKNMENLPEFDFYNDTKIKGSYLGVLGKQIDEKERIKNLITKVEEDLEIPIEFLKDKKVFFIDEVFSLGVGAASIKKIKDELGADYYYFALAYDPRAEKLKTDGVWEEKNYPLTLKEHENNMNAVFQDQHFIVYKNSITQLFSRAASRLYITENNNYQTIGRKMPLTPEQLKKRNIENPNMKIPDGRDNYVPPNGLSWEEYYSQIRQIEMNTVKTVKQKVLEAIKN